MSKEVKVTISKDGSKMEWDAYGFKGASCRDFAKSILEAVGTVEEEKKKPSYFEQEHAGVRVGA